MDTCLPKLGRMFLVAFAILAMALSSSVQAKPSSETLAHLKAMDDVLERAGSLQKFLATPHLIDEYYSACRNYYLSDPQNRDDRFSIKSFKAILEQFKDLVKRHPEFAERAWKKRKVRPILTIRTEHPGFGVAEKPNFLRNFAAKLGMQVSDFDEPRNPGDLPAQLEKFRAEWNRVAGLNPKTKKEKDAQKEEFKTLKLSQETLALRANLLRKMLTHKQLRTLLRDSEADLVISAFDQLREHGLTLVPELKEYEKEIRILISTLPQTKSFYTDEQLFRQANVMEWVDNSQYEYVDVAYPFHSLFRGIFHAECTGGDCAYLHWLNEARWGIPLLEGGHEIHVLRDGVYTGYISNVLVERDKHRYFALEVLTQFMRNRIWTMREFESGAISLKRSLLDVWIDREMARNDGEVEGYLAGQSRAINPAGGLESIRLSEAWMAGKLFGDSKSFRPVDSMAKALLENPRNHQMNDDYKNDQLIFDLGVIPAGEAVLMKSSDFDFVNLRNPYWALNQLDKGAQEANKFWSSLWFLPQFDQQGTGQVLTDRAQWILRAYENHGEPNHESARKFLNVCSYFCMHGLFKYLYWGDMGIKDFSRALHVASRLPSVQGDIQVWLVDEKFDGVLKQVGDTFPLDDFKTLLGGHVNPIAKARMLNKFAGATRSMSDFLDLTRIPDDEPKTREAYGEMLIGQLPNVELMNPTTAQWRTYYERLNNYKHHFMAVRSALRLAQTSTQFLERIEWPVGTSGDMLKQRQEFDLVLAELAPRLLELEPWPELLSHYISKIGDANIKRDVQRIFNGEIDCAEIVVNNSKKAKQKK